MKIKRELPQITGMESATGQLGLYPGRDDLWLVHFPDGAQCGGLFTQSTSRSADVDWCRNALRCGQGKARALIVNSGNSNAFTGEAGIAKNNATVNSTKKLAGCTEHQIFLAATGIIGEALPPKLVANSLPKLWTQLQPPDWHKAAKSIMTTDTTTKMAACSINIQNTTVHISGIAKGSGMIAPNMATMLAYIFTDAPLNAELCQSMLIQNVETSFNAISVDGDTSTSDTLMLFATGKAPCTQIIPNSTDANTFSNALAQLMQSLAIQIIQDGEGAQKLVKIHVLGAQDNNSAKKIAASIANSPLVKTAIGAEDPNWGRILMAAGKAGEPFERDKAILHIGDLEIARNGARSPLYSEKNTQKALQQNNVHIQLDAATGKNGHFTIWTCDLTHSYININGHYRT